MSSRLVFGASGYIGGHLVPFLAAQGHPVRATARNVDVLESREWEGVEVAQADALRPETLDEVLQSHCADVDRDPGEITRSVHLGYGPDDDPAKLADRADEFFAAGVDLVVWSMRGDVRPGRLAPLAEALH